MRKKNNNIGKQSQKYEEKVKISGCKLRLMRKKVKISGCNLRIMRKKSKNIGMQSQNYEEKKYKYWDAISEI